METSPCIRWFMFPFHSSLDTVCKRWLRSERPRLLTLGTHTAFPPLSGGHQRGYQLNRAIADHGFSVLYVSPVLRRQAFSKMRATAVAITEHLAEIQLFRPFSQITNALLDRYCLPPLAFMLNPCATWNSRPVRDLAEAADALLIEHPWLSPHPCPELFRGKPLVLNAHNIEQDLFAPMLTSKAHSWVINRVTRTERNAFTSADLAFVCSEEDAQRATLLYQVPEHKLCVIPNGTETTGADPLTSADRSAARRALDLPDRATVIFVGSAHGPNVEGARRFLDVAQQSPPTDCQFLFVGRACEHLSGPHAPNVMMLGPVESLSKFYAAADIAINPVIRGAGTNVKMLEYMGAGLPTITTAIGARGLALESGTHAIVAPVQDFPARIRELLDQAELRSRLGKAGRNLVLERYSWATIGERAAVALERLVRQREEADPDSA
jgi:glycosyltransferase involved in cell wall biosynthesis